MTSRPRPVLIITMALAALAAVTGFAGLADLLPATVILWLLLVQAVAVAVSGVYLQSVVTPLSDPRASDGTPLRRLAIGGRVPPAPGVSRGDDQAPPYGHHGL